MSVFAVFPVVLIAAVLGAIVIAGLAAALGRKTPAAVRVVLAVPLVILALGTGFVVLVVYRAAREHHVTVARQEWGAPVANRDEATLTMDPLATSPGFSDDPVLPPAAPPHANNVVESLRDALQGAVGWGNRWQAEQQEVERKIQADAQALQEQMSAARKAQAEGIAKMRSQLRRIEEQVMRAATGGQTPTAARAAAARPDPAKAVAARLETAKAPAKPESVKAAAAKTPDKPPAVAVARPVVAPPAPAKAAFDAAPPGRGLIATKQRPEWADRPARLEEGSIVVTTSPYGTGAECDAVLIDVAGEAVKKYATYKLGAEAGQTARLTPEFLRTHVIKNYWLEPVSLSVGDMVQLHALLQFDLAADQQLQQQFRQTQAVQRQDLSRRQIEKAAGSLAGVLYLLAVAYGYLRIDLSTKGAYRWRLRLAATALVALPIAAILLVVA